MDLTHAIEKAENNDNRVLPEKDPDEFMLFYSFLEHTGRVTSDNARTLAPWFHEFQMGRYLEECDEVLPLRLSALTIPRSTYIHRSSQVSASGLPNNNTEHGEGRRGKVDDEEGEP